MIESALGIDWKSLKDETSIRRRSSEQAGSALKRFSPGAVFARIGLSRHYAGSALVDKVTALCQKHMEEEAEGTGQGEANEADTCR